MCSNLCECVPLGNYVNFVNDPGASLISYPLLVSEEAAYPQTSYQLCQVLPGLRSVTEGKGGLWEIFLYNRTDYCAKPGYGLVSMEPDKAYLIDIVGINKQSFTMWGMWPTTDKNITLSPGWNWIGWTSPGPALFQPALPDNVTKILTAQPNCSIKPEDVENE